MDTGIAQPGRSDADQPSPETKQLHLLRRLRNGFGAALVGALIANLIVRHLTFSPQYWPTVQTLYWTTIALSFSVGLLVLYEKDT